MKRIINEYLLLVISIVLILTIASCTTTPVNQAGKTLVTAQITVDKAMTGWATWVVIHGASEEAQNQVRFTYSRYQAAMRTAKLAYSDLALSGERTSYENAEKVLNVAIASFMLAINHGKTSPTNSPPMPIINAPLTLPLKLEQ